jgi:hypothetical protein
VTADSAEWCGVEHNTSLRADLNFYNGARLLELGVLSPAIFLIEA